MGTLNTLDPWAQTIREIRQHQARRAAVNARVRTITPDVADRMARSMRVYPQVGLSYHEAFAKQRLSLDDPTVRQIIDGIYQHNAADYAPRTVTPAFAARNRNWRNRDAEWGDEMRQPFVPPSTPPNRRPMSTRDENFHSMPPGIQKLIMDEGYWRDIAEKTPQLYPFRTAGVLDGAGNLRRPGQFTEPKIGSPSRPKTPDDARREQKFFELASMIYEQTGMEEIPYVDATYGPSVINAKTALKHLHETTQIPMAHNYTDAINVGRYPIEEGVHRSHLINTAIDMIGEIQIPQVNTGLVPKQMQMGGPGQEAPNIKSFVRSGAMVLDAAGYQGPVGAFRDIVAGDVPTLSSIGEQTDLGQYLRLGPGSAGTGYLVSAETEVAQRRHEQELARGEIGGHAITPGRWLADQFNLSPDTIPFDLVSGGTDLLVQLADPTVLAANKIRKISEARRLFEPEEITGLFQGIRKQFHGPAWSEFRNTKAGIAVREILKNENNARKIWNINPHWNPEWAHRFAEAKTTDEVDAIFEELIGSHIRSTHDLSKLPARAGDGELLGKLNPQYTAQLAQASPLTAMLPTFHLDAMDKRQAAEHLQRWMRLGKADDSVMDEAFNMIASAQTKNQIEQAAELAMTHEKGILAKAGVTSQQRRNEMTRLFTQSREDALTAVFDDVTSDMPIREALISQGKRVQDISPQLTTEYLQRYVPLPDIRQVQRALADPKWRWLVTPLDPKEIGRARFPKAAVDSFMTEFWKPSMLLGRFPAWITRVVGEEQLRIMASGLDGINHPMSYFAIAVGKRNIKPPSGVEWGELYDFERSMAKVHGGGIRKPGATRATPILIAKNDPNVADDFLRAFGDEVAHLHYTPTTRTLAQSGVDNTIAWLKNTELGRMELRKYREAEPGMFDTDAQIRRHLEDTLGERFHMVTNDNPQLMEAIRTGKLDGINIFKKGRGTKLDPKFLARLDEAYLPDAPDLVKGFEHPTLTQRNKWQKAVDWGFAHTMTMATDFWSRAPVFKQYFYRELGRLLPYADDEVIEKALAGARSSKASRRAMKALEEGAAKRTTTVPRKLHSLEEVEHLAAGYAADTTKRLLYDYAERGNLAEALPIIAPFANAYQEMLTTWPKILFGKQYGIGGKIAQTVRVSRRVQQTVEGARRSGIIMKNQWGEEVFVMPFSEWYTKRLSGVPVPMVGKVSGLNMISTNIFPGMGPVLSVPVAALLADKPGTFQTIYDELLPFGAPGERRPDDIFNALSYLPSWMQKMVMAASAGPPPGLDQVPGVKQLWNNLRPDKDEVMWDNVAFMNVQKDIMKYYLSTGQYDVSSPGDMQRVLKDSHEAAKDLYFIRAGLQFFAPTAPSFNFVTQDKSGRTVAFAAVMEEFYSNIDDGMTMDEATMNLIDKYGVNIFDLTIPKTKGTSFATPRTKEAAVWLAQHPGVRDGYPSTYGLFAPQGGEFDYSVLSEQYASGAVDVLTPRQWLNLRNDMLKNMQYYFYRDQVGEDPSDEEQQWLDRIRSELEEAYPSSTHDIVKFDEDARNDAIRELYDATKDPELKNTQMGKALTAYFYYRDQAQQFAEDSGYKTFSKPKGMYATREWLAGVAHDIIKDYPDFRLAWSTLLSREFDRELR